MKNVDYFGLESLSYPSNNTSLFIESSQNCIMLTMEVIIVLLVYRLNYLTQGSPFQKPVVVN